MEPVPCLVTLHVWRVPRAKVPAALARMVVDRGRARRTPGVRFAKMLGTGDGFLITDSDPTRWAKLAAWSTPGSDPVAMSWNRIAEETFRVDLRPLASTGRWGGREPFGRPQSTSEDSNQNSGSRYDGPVAAVTRARLAPTRLATFWKAVPDVVAGLQQAPGLRATLAVGEAPVGLQGTFSLWDSVASLKAFAYDGAAHTDAIARTTRVGWYAEELFARFAVLGGEGTLDGKSLLA